MAYTSTQLTDLLREIMDSVGSTEWSDTTLRTWCGMAQWKLQADLLGVNNTYYFNNITTLSQDSSGQIAVSGLSTGTGDTKKYFFRVLSVAMPSTTAGQISFYYRKSRYQEFPNPQPNTSLPYVWYRIGANLQILPVAAGQAMTIATAYRPPRCDQLSTVSIAVDFPEGYEELISWWAASTALVKGGSEVQGAAGIRATATEMRDNFLQELGRESTWPIVAQSFDLSEDWSG